MAMKINNKNEKKYLRETKNLLICDAKKKNDALRAYQNEIEEYLDENPNANYENIVEFFGSPLEAATEVAADVPITYIKKRMNIAATVLVGVIAAVVIWGIGVTAAVTDSHVSSIAYFEEELTIGSEIDDNNITLPADVSQN